MLIKLVDGGIKNISTDEDSMRGCETCDYGSEYINTMEMLMDVILKYVEIQIAKFMF